jgi:tetratricopeptide (TPR) repeat protein
MRYEGIMIRATNLQITGKCKIQHVGKVVVLVFLLGGCSESKETRLQRFLQQGNDMVMHSNDEQAISYYQNALRLDSCFADAWNNLGTVYFKRRDFDRAVVHYTRAIECRSQYADAYLNRANAFYETNELQNSLRDLDFVERKNPDTVVIHFLRGLIYTRLRDYEKARLNFEHAIAVDPGNPELKVNLGTVYYYQKKYDSALTLLRSIPEETKEPNAYNTLSLIETATGNYPEAMRWISEALKLRPNDPYYLNNRGYIYLLMNETERGLADINESIAQDPHNAWAYRNKGIYYLLRSDAEAAARMFKEAEGRDPHLEDIYYYLGEAHWRLGQRERACTYYEKSLEMHEGRKPDMKRCIGK